MIERLKIRAISQELGLPDSVAQTLVQLHGLTKGGKQPEKLVLRDGETATQKLGFFARFENRSDDVGQQIRSVRRLYEDPDFREQMLATYRQDILPRMGNIGPIDVLRIALKTHNQ